MSHPVMLALKGAIGQGTKFSLTQQSASPHVVLLEIKGVVSSVSLNLPFNWISGKDESKNISDFEWESSSYTAGILVSAVEAMPEEACPQILLNTSLWDGGGLILSGEWETKRGRAKEPKKHYRIFMLDAGVHPSAT